MLLSLPAQAEAAAACAASPVPLSAKTRRSSSTLQTRVQDWAQVRGKRPVEQEVRTLKQRKAGDGQAQLGVRGPNCQVKLAVVSTNAELLREVASLCALVGANVLSVPNLAHPGSWWQQATGVIVDAAALPSGLPTPGLQRRDRVAVVTSSRNATTPSDPSPHHLWQRALELGAQAVWALPADQQELAHHLGQWVLTQASKAVTVGVIGGCGGVGTSTLAAALALAGSRRQLQTVLIDADPLGGGIDLLLGGEFAQGSRWPHLAQASGLLDPQALREELPSLEQMFVLSWDRQEVSGITGEAMRAVVGAAQRGSDLVVIDLPRHRTPYADAALVGLDLCLLYVDATVRAVAAAQRIQGSLDGLVGQIQVVGRSHPHDQQPAVEQLLQALGRPLAGVIKHDPSVTQALQRGMPPGYTGKGAVAQWCSRLLDELFPTPAMAA